MSIRQEEDPRLAAFGRLLQIMDDLREKCPWDRKQTMESLRNLTIEETYELAEAITSGDLESIKEETGDLMLHLIFYAKIAQEGRHFDIADVLTSVCDKLVQRHPHIYGDIKVDDEDDVKRNWEVIKMRSTKRSLLAVVPDSLPAMVKAYRLQDKTRQVGFEWMHTDDVWSKLEEELSELKSALGDAQATAEQKMDEFGDVLFSLINFGRYQGIDAESALARVNAKFKRRFEYIEAHATKPLIAMSLTEMDALWDEAKAHGL